MFTNTLKRLQTTIIAAITINLIVGYLYIGSRHIDIDSGTIHIDNVSTTTDYYDDCPDGFPRDTVSVRDLKDICIHVDRFAYNRPGNYCNISNCAQCITPNSQLDMHKNVNKRVSLWQTKYEQTKSERRAKLEAQLMAANHNRSSHTVVLMAFNYGYAWLFLNWLCSLEQHLAETEVEAIKAQSIIIVTDNKSDELVSSLGFMTHFVGEWLPEQKFDEDASAAFAWGSHSTINAMSIALMTDLIALNHSVLLQDVDIVWNRNPIPYLMRKSAAHGIDIGMSYDKRMDSKGPGNSGFVFIRSNCKTKVFTKTFWNMIGLGAQTTSDQLVWNMLIDTKRFRQLKFVILDSKLFVNGHQVNLEDTTGYDMHPDHYTFHASWTADYFDKIEKFYNVEHLYFSKEKCPRHYDKRMVADVRKRSKRKAEKDLERDEKQQRKFVNLGFMRDARRL